MVSIIPGMEARAPERTETSRGFSQIAELLAGDLLHLAHIVHDLFPRISSLILRPSA